MIKQEFLLTNKEGIALYKVSSDQEAVKIARIETPDVVCDAIVNIQEKTLPELFIEILDDENMELTQEEAAKMLEEVF